MPPMIMFRSFRRLPQKKVPELNGKPFELNPGDTCSSPYLTMVHGSDKATIKYPGYDDLVIDFGYTKGPAAPAI